MDAKRQQELLEVLEQICDELGWEIAVPTSDPDVPARGLIVGEPEFLSEVLTVFGVDYDSFGTKDGEIVETKTVTDITNKKKQTFH